MSPALSTSVRHRPWFRILSVRATRRPINESRKKYRLPTTVVKPTNHETQLYNAEHTLDGKTCARGQSRVDLDFMDVVAQRKIQLAESILFHIGADRFRTGRNHGFAGRSFGQRENVAHFGRHDDDFFLGLTVEVRLVFV